MRDLPPLLAALFSEGHGCILFKAYPPHRGDDVLALQRLSIALPPTIRFKMMPPEQDLLRDLRDLVPSVVKWLSGRKCSSRDRRRLEPLLRNIITQAARDPAVAITADDALERLAENADVEDLLLQILASRPIGMEWEAHSSNSPEHRRRDFLRSRVPIPLDVPVLIIGRPELMLGYETPAGQAPTDFRTLMDSIGYPNRFQFLGETPTSHERAILDRGSWQTHGRDRRAGSDVGFVSSGRNSRGQRVMVATGSSSLGTAAAVELLLRSGPVFARCAEEISRQKNPRALDIGFSCRFDAVDSARPFPLNSADDLAIEVVNPGDLLGFEWARQSHEVLGPLLVTSDRLPLVETTFGEADPCMRWTLESAQKRGAPRHFRIRARPFRITHQRWIFGSAAFGELLLRIEEEIPKDREDWYSILRRKYSPRDQLKLSMITNDQEHRTFRPVLVLGQTGAGKEIIAQLIAFLWQGETLGDQLLPQKPAGARATWLQDAAAKSIEERGSRYPDQAKQTAPYVCNTLGYPATLLHAALFGTVDGYATDVVPTPGAFLASGTGVLLLEEFLELPMRELLVALQRGKVMPLGADREYACLARVVAATNRASCEDELRELEDRNEVRRDLARRFHRRYVVPPLRDRPLEIIPLLMRLLFEATFPDQPITGRTEPLYLRMTRRAFSALVGYAFPGNVRDLQQLADRLGARFGQHLIDPDPPPEATVRFRDVAALWADTVEPSPNSRGDDELLVFEFLWEDTPAGSPQAETESDPIVGPIIAALADSDAILRAYRKRCTANASFADIVGSEKADVAEGRQLFTKLHRAWSQLDLEGKTPEKIAHIRRALQRSEAWQSMSNQLPLYNLASLRDPEVSSVLQDTLQFTNPKARPPAPFVSLVLGYQGDSKV